jgi:DNA-binding MarR family transcriptional regulator
MVKGSKIMGGLNLMASTKKDNLVEDILTLADRLFRQLLPTVPKELLSLDVTMPQLKIMMILFINGPERMSDIAAALDIALPTATSLVDRLVEKHYVIREDLADDRRVVLCRLSETGQKAIGHIWESSRIRSRELLEAMDTIKLQMFVEILEAMLESADATPELSGIENKTPSRI